MRREITPPRSNARRKAPSKDDNSEFESPSTPEGETDNDPLETDQDGSEEQQQQNQEEANDQVQTQSEGEDDENEVETPGRAPASQQSNRSSLRQSSNNESQSQRSATRGSVSFQEPSTSRGGGGTAIRGAARGRGRGRGRRQSGPSRETPARQRKQTRPRRNFGWLKEVRRLQKSTQLLVPKLPFARLVREILINTSRWDDIRITKEALMALHESAEMYLTYFFEDANRLAIHARRVTIMPRDMQLIYLLRTNWGNTC